MRVVSDDPQEHPADVSDEEIVDALPEDLDLSEFVGPYTFPNNNRRRIPAAIYLVLGLACLAWWAAARNSSPLTPSTSVLDAFEYVTAASSK